MSRGNNIKNKRTGIIAGKRLLGVLSVLVCVLIISSLTAQVLATEAGEPAFGTTTLAPQEGSDSPDLAGQGGAGGDSAGENGYTVTFIPGNGQDDFTVPVAGEAAVAEPEAPTAPRGMAFDGWYLADDSTREIIGSDPYIFASPVVGDIWLKAKYSAPADMLTVRFFDSRDSDATVIDSKPVAVGEKVERTQLESLVVLPRDTALAGWTADKTADVLFDFANTPVTQDLDLYPVYEGLYYVTFNTGGGSAVPTQVLKAGQHAVMPGAPTRQGYSFLRWSATPGGPAFNFDTPIAAGTELFAVWEGAEVGYTVTYWLEDVNTSGAKSYTPFYSYRQRAVAGTAVSYTASTVDANHVPAYSQFARSDKKAIAGNGTTVVNVYFDRTVYTIYFDLKETGATMTTGGVSYTRSANRADMFRLEVKYGQDVSGVWPVGGVNGTSFTNGSGTSAKFFTGWTAPNSLGAELWASKRVTVTESMLPSGNETSYTLTATWGTVGMRVTLNYMFEALPGYSTAGKTYGVEYVERNGKVYAKSDAYSQDVFAAGGAFGFKDIEGMRRAANSALALNAQRNGLELISSGTQANQYLLYDRNSYSITVNFRDGQDHHNGSDTIVISNAMYGAPLGHYTGSFTGVAPTRENYRFVGWAYEADATVADVNLNTATVPGHDMQIFALWESTNHTAYFFNSPADMGDIANAVRLQGFDTTVRFPEGLYEEGRGYADSRGNPLGMFLGWYVYTGDGQGNQVAVEYNFDLDYHENQYIFARWKTEGFRVTYYANGGTGDVPVDNAAYSLGVNLSVRDADLRYPNTQKVFVGWRNYNEGAILYPGDILQMTGDAHLYAVYADGRDHITLTYAPGYPGSGQTDITTKVVRDTPYRVPANSVDYFVRGRYKIIGWTTQEGSNVPEYLPGEHTSFGGETILYACWEYVGEYYEVRFESNGGTPVAPVSGVREGETIAKPADPTRAHYDFLGWYKEPGLANRWNFDTDAVTENITLYAKWTLKTYTVTFDSRGGTGVAPYTDIAYGAHISAPANPTRDGYAFGGWYGEPECVNRWAFADDTVTGNITLYARWDAQTSKFVVVFDGNGGTSRGTMQADRGEALGSLPSVPLRTGYTFNGWNTSPNGGGTRFTAKTKVTGDMTVYAQWSAGFYRLRFILNGAVGAPPTTQSLRMGEFARAVRAPQRTGYTFAGWNTSPGGDGAQWDFGAMPMPGHDVTLYAQWRGGEKDAGGGDGSGSANAAAGAAGGGAAGTGTAGDDGPNDGQGTGMAGGAGAGGGANAGKAGGNGGSFAMIRDNAVPLFGFRHWSLANMVFAMFGGVLALASLMAGFSHRRSEEEEAQEDYEDEDTAAKRKRRQLIRLSGVLVALLLIILFIFTQNMLLPMAIVDGWTALTALLFLGEVVLLLASRRKKQSGSEPPRGMRWA